MTFRLWRCFPSNEDMPDCGLDLVPNSDCLRWVSVILYPLAIDGPSASVSASVGASFSANASDPVVSNIRSFMVDGNNCAHVNWFIQE